MRRHRTFQPAFIPNFNRSTPMAAKFISGVTYNPPAIAGLGEVDFPSVTVSLLWVGLGLAAALALWTEFK